jgi:transposase-like protein
MTRKHFTHSEISEALQALEAGVRVPEVCHRLGVSELTLGRWRRKAGLLKKPLEPVAPESLTVEQAAHRVGGLEQRLEAFRQVMVSMLEPPELEQAARLLESNLSVSAVKARLLLGLPARRRSGPPATEAGAPAVASRPAEPYQLRSAKESR